MSTYARYSSEGPGGGGGGGGVTNVTGSSPISSSGGATPNISIQQADSTHNGFLSSTDWNRFDDKVDGPASSVDNQLAIFNGTSGQLLKTAPLFASTSELFPSADNTIDLGDSTHRYKNIYLSNSLNLNTNTLVITTIAGMVVFDTTAGNLTYDFRTNGHSRLYIADDKPQVSIIKADTFFEQNSSPNGSIGWLDIGVNDIGWVQGQQDVLPGFHAPRNIALSNIIFFVANSDAAGSTLSSALAQFKFNGGTIAGADKGVTGQNFDFFHTKGSDNTSYFEQYLGAFGLKRAQTNLNFGMNSSGTFGKLAITDLNGNPNGKRLETVTLSGGSATVSNTSVSANTCFFHEVRTPSNQGWLSFSPNAGVGYTVTSTNVLDASVIKVFLVENGYPGGF